MVRTRLTLRNRKAMPVACIRPTASAIEATSESISGVILHGGM
ncbi:hypothetical protein [Thiolapillus sp.]|nr:hypothetical protein [Thiolapillus sp.]